MYTCTYIMYIGAYSYKYKYMYMYMYMYIRVGTPIQMERTPRSISRPAPDKEQKAQHGLVRVFAVRPEPHASAIVETNQATLANRP